VAFHTDPITGLKSTLAGDYDLAIGVRTLLQLPAILPAENALIYQPLVNFQLDALELSSQTGADEQTSGTLGASDNSDTWVCPDDYRYLIYSIYTAAKTGNREVTTMRLDPRGSTLVHVPIAVQTAATSMLFVPSTPFPMSPGDAINLLTGSGGGVNGPYETIVWYKRVRIFSGSPGWASVTA